MKPAYVPERGDVIWLDFDPQAGREQANRRPALVLSRSAENARSRLAIVCPITSQSKGYAAEVPTPEGFPVSGFVLADHVKSQDWWQRGAVYWCQLPPAFVNLVAARVATLLF